MSDEYIVTIDLGTTNIKTAVFDSSLKELSVSSSEVRYQISGNIVEFDPDVFWELCGQQIREAVARAGIDPRKVRSLSLTGQAESIVLLDDRLRPLRMGISWMDNRSQRECEELREKFPPEAGYAITGQPDVTTTWPITKALWLRENEHETFSRVSKYLLVKDFILHRLTGKLVGEYSVYNFSYYFDIVHKRFWKDILEFVGIRETQLPELIEPGENAGTVTAESAKELGLSGGVLVNAGALDHFAGMIGSGNIREGMVSETTGTVLAIATMVQRPMMGGHRLPCHYSAMRDTYVLLPVCESGGISLEWFKRNFYPDSSYGRISEEIEKIAGAGEVIFLPYLTGTNSPELDPKAQGVFYGIRLRHSRAHLARAVMEGVSFLLKKNLDSLERLIGRVSSIVSLGGGARSGVWNQIKADVTGRRIHIPESGETTSLGAAVLAAVKCGYFSDVPSAVERSVRTARIFEPAEPDRYGGAYRKFLDIYDRLTPVFHEA